MSHQRPPSAARPPTSGVPHGMRPPSRTRNGTEIAAPGRGISVVTRPMSGQGLPSAHKQSGGRQVADKSYFIGILRQKVNDVVKEIERLQAEIETRKRGQSIEVNISQQVADLRKEIAQGEAELADYNVLADRVGNGTTVEDMMTGYDMIVQSNRQCEEDVNKLFKEKKELESIVVGQEKQVEEMMSGKGAPELQAMAKEIESLDRQCEELRAASGDLQGKSRDQLLQMVKEATNAIGDTDRMIQDEQSALNHAQNTLKSLEDREGDLQTERGQQYLKLLQKEKEMTRFIQNFPTAKDQVLKSLAEYQRHVVEILAATSRDLESIKEMPTVDNFKQMQTDLAYKERQMQDAQATTQALQAEVQQRRREYEDLKNVDKKIEDEIELLKQTMVDMEGESPKFEDVQSIREDGEARKKLKTQERDQLKTQLHNLRKATNALAVKYNETRSANRGNELESKLHLLEKEIRQRAAENHTTAEGIEENRRRTNYSLVKRASMNIVQEINSML